MSPLQSRRPKFMQGRERYRCDSCKMTASYVRGSAEATCVYCGGGTMRSPTAKEKDSGEK